MHHIDIYLDNDQISTKNQNSLGIEHQKLGISTEKGRRDHKMKKMCKIEKSKSLTVLTRRSISPLPINQFFGIWGY